MKTLDRRNFLMNSLGALGALSLGPGLTSMVSAQPFLDYRTLKNLGPLQAANAVGMRLPAGFTGQLIAQSKKKVRRADGTETSYVWHTYPDGGACFATEDGGWIYTSNCEVPLGGGGAGAIRFDSNGGIVDAYSILDGTTSNCAGGPTPWGTWLSCEEHSGGRVYECDPYGQSRAVLCEGLGKFKHEAAAVDPIYGHVYMTEDESDGRFYRYTPSEIDSDGRMNLQKGLLEVAIVDGNGNVTWAALDNPVPGTFATPTRKQIKNSRAFDGGEGIWFHEGKVYLTSKGDNRVWSYSTIDQTLGIVYDKSTDKTKSLSGVDNVVVSKDGHILVAEDGDDMQIVVLGPFGDMYPIVQLINQNHSEITGPAINPLNNRLYFSSQRGTENLFSSGATYQLAGPLV
ncbi:MAG TPA: alkaline phosphatase PhoX [Oligoflexus sp.]|uniref:alkaline phosphatase PhoX n=1 Tax=Oligoflexus sp. TaxID=1971216 RepID=UPI002D6ECB9D|nr:alkaline phosphatase PhoX [Oligoflexus sp.]HYX32170.1 alkaline phosphatase PhoX [Oligoflexus sp.]